MMYFQNSVVLDERNVTRFETKFHFMHPRQPPGQDGVGSFIFNEGPGLGYLCHGFGYKQVSKHVSLADRKKYLMSSPSPATSLATTFAKQFETSDNVGEGRGEGRITVFGRPMKIDIIFLVNARMGFRRHIKKIHYSLFLKERLGKIQIIHLAEILLQCTTVAPQKPRARFFIHNSG